MTGFGSLRDSAACRPVLNMKQSTPSPFKSAGEFSVLQLPDVCSQLWPPELSTSIWDQVFLAKMQNFRSQEAWEDSRSSGEYERGSDDEVTRNPRTDFLPPRSGSASKDAFEHVKHEHEAAQAEYQALGRLCPVGWQHSVQHDRDEPPGLLC